MIHEIFCYTVVFYFTFRDEIKSYLRSRQSPQMKYALWCKWRADYNHANGIIDESQYDYLHRTEDYLRDEDEHVSLVTGVVRQLAPSP